MARQSEDPAFEAALDALRLDDYGDGRPILILHGGGGPRTVADLAQALSGDARVLAPTHPGFDGTMRPDNLNSIADLAAFYVRMLCSMDLEDVLIVGSSIGGWIASEIALLPDNRTSGLVLLDAVGIAVEDEKVADVFTLPPMEMVDRVFHDSERIRSSTPAPSDAQKALDAANLESLAIYDDRNGMQDPSLRARLSEIDMPVLVLWGESDRVASVRYGRAYADSITGAAFEIVAKAGHLPQIEQPERTIGSIRDFISRLER